MDGIEIKPARPSAASIFFMVSLPAYGGLPP
jgi:hypothetical protein